MRNFLFETIKLFCTVFTALSIIYYVGQDDSSWMSSILLPSLFFILTLSTLHILFMIALGAKSNFSVHQTEIIEIDVDLEKLSYEIEGNTHWILKFKSPTELVFNTTFNLKCWGEVIEIKKIGNVVLLKSKPVIFTTLVDYGKNYQNIQKLKSFLGKHELIVQN